MTQPPLDTLKVRAYGVKNATHSKEERMKDLSLADQNSQPKRYYQKSKDGNYDEWAALMASQLETATKQQQQIDKNKRQFIENEYGKRQYLEGLAQKKRAKQEQKSVNEQERRLNDEQFSAFQMEAEKKKLDQMKLRQQYNSEMEAHIYSSSNASKQIAQFEKDMALQQQKERITSLMQREQGLKQMRFEWRKNCDSSHEQSISEFKQRTSQEKKEMRNGPTTIGALGSHYEQQLQKLQRADERMEARAGHVAEVIQAPTLKDSTIETMVQASPIINDYKTLETDEKRQNLIKESSRENYARHLQMRSQMLKSNFAKQVKARERNSSTDEVDISNVQVAAIWRQIDQNLLSFKKDSQSKYKSMLDEQVKHKQLLKYQGNMTQMEKSLNKGELNDYKAGGEHTNAMVLGLFNESPLKNVSRTKKSPLHNSKLESKAEWGGAHYNIDAPPGHWKPQHRRAQSLMVLKPVELEAESVADQPSVETEEAAPQAEHQIEDQEDYDKDEQQANQEQPDQEEQEDKSVKSGKQAQEEQEGEEGGPDEKSTLGDKGVKKINSKRLAHFNKNLLSLQANSGVRSQVGSRIAASAAPSKKSDAKSIAQQSLLSKASVGRISTISKRSKAVPLEAIFKAGTVSARSKNSQKQSRLEEPKQFGRWLMRREFEKYEHEKGRSHSVLETVAEAQPKQKQTFAQRGNSLPSIDSLYSNQVHRRDQRPIGNPQNMQLDRLNQLGLDPRDRASKIQLNGGKILDQMQPHRDLASYYTKTGMASEDKSQLDYKRLAQHRAQQLPLGGMLGERVAKSISLYGAQPQQADGSKTETVTPRQSQASPSKQFVEPSTSGRFLPGKIRGGSKGRKSPAPGSRFGVNLAEQMSRSNQQAIKAVLNGEKQRAIPLKQVQASLKEAAIPSEVKVELE